MTWRRPIGDLQSYDLRHGSRAANGPFPQVINIAIIATIVCATTTIIASTAAVTNTAPFAAFHVSGRLSVDFDAGNLLPR